MPRYFALGAGESEVKVKNIYMVEIETLKCQSPFVSQRIGGTFQCVLECHAESSHLGCHGPNDNTYRVAYCEGKEGEVQCVATCGDNLKIVKVNHPELNDQDNPSQIVCMSCHHEC